MKKLLKVKNDFIFQRIFGQTENTDILTNLLEAILKVKITSLEIIENTKLYRDKIKEKQGVVDVRAVIDNDIRVNIEIQLINQYNMDKRTLFYWSKMYAEQLKTGEEYKELKKTITINILDFNYIKGIEKYHTTFHLREDEYNDYKLTDILEMHFIELPKFLRKEEKNIKNSLERWLLFIENTKTSQEVMKVLEREEPAIKKAKKVLDYLSEDEETIRCYEIREKAIHDEVSRLRGAREEGIQKGKKEGIKEGQIEEKRNVTINLLKKNVDIEIIKVATGLTAEEIKELKKEI